MAEYDEFAKQCTIEGYQDRLMEAHGKLNELLQRALYTSPPTKEMDYPCDSTHPMTNLNGECQELVRTIKEMSRRLACLGVENI